MKDLKAKSFERFLIRLYTVHLIVFFPLLVFTHKGEVLLWINKYHSPFGDFFFKNITHLGDGIVFPFLILALLFVRYYDALLALFSAVLHAIFIYFFKKILIKGAMRPIAFFHDSPIIDLVDGVTLHAYRSFPSGHTTSGFVLALVLSIVIGRKSWAVFFLALAYMVGISRVYLLQHFFMDVYIGSALALFTVLLSWLLLDNARFFKGKKWIQTSLWQVLKKKSFDKKTQDIGEGT